MKNISFEDNKILKILFWYRIGLCFLVEFFVQNFTRRGDTPYYLNANPINLIKTQSYNVLTDGTPLTQLIVGSVHTVVRVELITHILFTILAYYGIKVFLNAVSDKKSKYYKYICICKL